MDGLVLLKLVPFYKLNHSLSKGTALKRTGLNPRYLIQMGKTVNVTIKGKNIKLKAKAFSLGNAKLGDDILLKNIKSKKNFFGKASNFNEATVEL